MRVALVLTLPCVAQALRVPGPGRMPPQKPINHHLPGAVAEPRPDAIQQLRRNDFGDLHSFLKSFESCATPPTRSSRSRCRKSIMWSIRPSSRPRH